jgi:hypothetical protein
MVVDTEYIMSLLEGLSALGHMKMSNNQGGTMLVIEKFFSGVDDEFGCGWSPSKRATLCLQSTPSSSYILVYFAFLF